MKLARWWHVWWWGWDIAPARMIRTPLERLMDRLVDQLADVERELGRAILPSARAAALGLTKVAERLQAQGL